MPSFKPFGDTMGSTIAPVFEIRLENEFIVLRGTKSEASSQVLRGVVVLCLIADLKVKDVHLQMTGLVKTGHKVRGTFTTASIYRLFNSIEIFNHQWPDLIGGNRPVPTSNGTLLPPGNYEWPFELVIDGSMAETIEGLADTYITYNLKASITRGKLAHDLHAWKPVRIVRTLSQAVLERVGPVTVEEVWANKLDYQIIIPRRHIVFGSDIVLDMTLIPLLKGLRIGTITCYLYEHQELAPLEAHMDAESCLRVVDSWNFELNDGEHFLQKLLPLPKQLSKCLQDAEVCGIKIRHEVKLNIALHNPDGHISDLRVTLPITIFISPNMPINAEGCLVDQAPQSLQEANIASHPPPLYSEHILDQLYAVPEQSLFTTYGPHYGTDVPPCSRSSSSSSASFLPSTGRLSEDGFPHVDLSSRTQYSEATSHNNNAIRGHPRVHSSANTLHFEGISTEHYLDLATRGVLRRDTGAEDEAQGRVLHQISSDNTPDDIYCSQLSKVPSYSTAVRAPIPSRTSSALPSYCDVAVSRRLGTSTFGVR